MCMLTDTPLYGLEISTTELAWLMDATKREKFFHSMRMDFQMRDNLVRHHAAFEHKVTLYGPRATNRTMPTLDVLKMPMDDTLRNATRLMRVYVRLEANDFYLASVGKNTDYFHPSHFEKSQKVRGSPFKEARLVGVLIPGDKRPDRETVYCVRMDDGKYKTILAYYIKKHVSASAIILSWDAEDEEWFY